MVTQLQYAKPADAEKRLRNISNSKAREINLPQQKENKKILQNKITSLKNDMIKQNTSEAKKEYEKALKQLPGNNISYEERKVKFNEWVEKNKDILQNSVNFENAKKLIETEQRIQNRLSRKEFEKVKQQYNPTGDYNTQADYTNQFLQQNQDVLTRGGNISEAKQFINKQEQNLKELNRVEYESTKKELFKTDDYNKKIENVNEFIEKNKEVLSRGDNFEKTQELLKKQEREIKRLNRKEFEKLEQNFKPSGDVDTRVEEINTFLETNKDVLARGDNYLRSQELIFKEQGNLENFEKLMPIKKAQEFNPNEFVTYNFDTQKATIKNPEKYNITYYTNGKIKSIKEKPKTYEIEYRKKKGRSPDKTEGTYIPREIFFDENGNIIREVTYNNYTVFDRKDQDDWLTKDKVYKQSEKIYGKDGILKSYKEWDKYDKNIEKDGKRRFTEEDIYLEKERIYDSTGNMLSRKEWGDIQTTYDKYSDGYDRQREVYLNREYDYIKGIKTNYPSPSQESVTYNLTQDEVSDAKQAEKIAKKLQPRSSGILIRDPKTNEVTGGTFKDIIGKKVTSEEAKLISQGLISQKSVGNQQAQLKDIESYYTKAKTTYEKAGLKTQAQEYKNKINEIKVQQLFVEKSKLGKEVTTKDLMGALGTDKVGELIQNRDILLKAESYNKDIQQNKKIVTGINKLIESKGGKEGITAGELAKAAGGLGNLMGKDDLLNSIVEIDKKNRAYEIEAKKIKAELEKKEVKFLESEKNANKKLFMLNEKYGVIKLNPKQQLLMASGDNSNLKLTDAQVKDVNKRYNLQQQENYLNDLKKNIQKIESKPEIKSFYNDYYSDPLMAEKTNSMLEKAKGKQITKEISDYQKAYNKINKSDLSKLDVYTNKYNEIANIYTKDQTLFSKELERKEKVSEQLSATAEKLSDFIPDAKKRGLSAKEALYQKDVLSSRYKELSTQFVKDDIWKQYDNLKDDGTWKSKVGVFIEKSGNFIKGNKNELALSTSILGLPFAKIDPSKFRENTYEENIKKLKDVKKIAPNDRETIMVTEGAWALTKNKWSKGDYTGAIVGAPFTFAVKSAGYIGEGLIKVSEQKKSNVEKYIINKINDYEQKVDANYNDYLQSQKSRQGFLIAGDELKTKIKTESAYKRDKNMINSINYILNTKSKIDKGKSQIVKGAGEYLAYKPDSVASDIVMGVATAGVGTGAGISGKASAVTGKGIMATRAAKLGGKIAKYGLGSLYAGSVGLEVAMAPKEKRLEVIGGKAAQFTIFAASAKATEASIEGLEAMGFQNTNLRPYRKIARYILRGNKKLVEFRSPVKVSGFKNMLSNKIPKSLSIDFQKPIKINKLSNAAKTKMKIVEAEFGRFKQKTTSPNAKNDIIYRKGSGLKSQATKTEVMKEYSPEEYAKLFSEVKVIPQKNIIPKLRTRSEFKNIFETGEPVVTRGENGEILSQDFTTSLNKQGRGSFWAGDEIKITKAKTSQMAGKNVKKELEFYKRYKPKEKYKIVQEGSDFKIYKSSGQSNKFGILKAGSTEKKAVGELFTEGLNFEKLSTKDSLSAKEYSNFQKLYSQEINAKISRAKVEKKLLDIDTKLKQDINFQKNQLLKKERVELQRKELELSAKERDVRLKRESLFGDYYSISKAPIKKKPGNSILKDEFELKIKGKEYMVVEPKGQGRQAYDYNIFKNKEIPKSAVEKGTIPTYEKSSGILKKSVYGSKTKGDASTFSLTQNTVITESATAAKSQTVQTGIMDVGISANKPGQSTIYGELKSGGREVFKGFKSVKGDKPFFKQEPNYIKVKESYLTPKVGKNSVETAQRAISDKIGVNENIINPKQTYYRGVDNFELSLLKKTGQLTPHGNLNQVWITPSKKIATSYGKNVLEIKIDGNKVKSEIGRSKLKYTNEPIRDVKILRDVSGKRTPYKEIIETSKISKPRERFIFETSEVIEARMGIKNPSGTFKGIYERTTERPNADLGGISSTKYVDSFTIQIKTSTPRYELLRGKVKGYSSFSKDIKFGLRDFRKTGKISFGNALGSIKSNMYEPVKKSAKQIKEKSDSLAQEISGLKSKFQKGKEPSQDFISKLKTIDEGQSVKVSQKQVQTTDGRSETIIEATQSQGSIVPEARQFQTGKVQSMGKVKAPEKFTFSNNILKPRARVRTLTTNTRSFFAPMNYKSMEMNETNMGIVQNEQLKKPFSKYSGFADYQSMPESLDSFREMGIMKEYPKIRTYQSPKYDQRTIQQNKSQLKSEQLNREKYKNKLSNIQELSSISDIKNKTSIVQKIKQKQLLDLQQRYKMNQISDFGEVGDGYEISKIDIPIITPIEKIKKPIIPPRLPKRKKQRKKPEKKIFTKGYSEKEFKILDLLGEKKRSKRLSFL